MALARLSNASNIECAVCTDTVKNCVAWFLVAELHLTLPPPQVLHIYIVPYQSFFLTAQVNSLPTQVKCQNSWGVKDFTWGSTKKLPPQLKKTSARLCAKKYNDNGN